jgi:acyl carrier protein
MTSRTVRDIVAEVLEVPADELVPESAPGKVEGWDSLATLEILAQVEEELGVSMDLEELAEIGTLGEWEERVDQKLAAAG